MSWEKYKRLFGTPPVPKPNDWRAGLLTADELLAIPDPRPGELADFPHRRRQEVISQPASQTAPKSAYQLTQARKRKGSSQPEMMPGYARSGDASSLMSIEQHETAGNPVAVPNSTTITREIAAYTRGVDQTIGEFKLDKVQLASWLKNPQLRPHYNFTRHPRTGRMVKKATLKSEMPAGMPKHKPESMVAKEQEAKRVRGLKNELSLFKPRYDNIENTMIERAQNVPPRGEISMSKAELETILHYMATKTQLVPRHRLLSIVVPFNSQDMTPIYMAFRVYQAAKSKWKGSGL